MAQDHSGASRLDPTPPLAPRAHSGSLHPSQRDVAPPAAPALGPERDSIVDVQKERYGGIKAGSAFFGWLTATGMAVLLTGLVAGAGAAVGVATNTDVNTATNSAISNPGTSASSARSPCC